MFNFLFYSIFSLHGTVFNRIFTILRCGFCYREYINIVKSELNRIEYEKKVKAASQRSVESSSQPARESNENWNAEGCGTPNCKVCYLSECTTAFLPCGHIITCAKCASSLASCPLYRSLFTYIIRVYLS